MRPVKSIVAASFFAALAAAALLAGCSGQELLNGMTPTSGYSVSNDIAFEDKHDLKLDVYTPDHARDAPVVVFFYGGRWEEGDKTGYRFVGQALAAQGFVAVIPDYRLYPKATYKQFLDDCAHAVTWIHRHARAYGGSADKLVVMGHSAGAYNAAMLALDPAFMKAAGGDRDWIKGMIGLSGPYDFLPLTAPDLRAIFAPPDQFDQAMPVFWANGGNPPLLLIASKADHTVEARNTEELFNRIKRAKGPVEKIIYKDLSHAQTVAVLSAPLRGRADILSNVADFVRRVTHTPAPAAPGS